ncbi:magnesium transporter NIPA-domain-containing protein [Naematelia encephala]|uniref:Magnesium transporter NIPA-domain-containing protein n=1 Tax=Naematelia encephala TaxID=71784 RepID=A0A1Y2B6M9_9TREE|nr:magnesium transporter NIPA-domain-containing protein [Naematelia encephala]
MIEDKYIGLALALGGTFLIGSSFIITKKGLIDAGKNPDNYPHSHQRQNAPRNASEDLAYLRNPIWWAGMITMIVGEVANFAAYTFAPAILVTPLGAMSVIIGAILASFLLDEKLGRLGICGCASCIIGSVIIVLHAPSDKEVETVDEILDYAARPAFLFYITVVAVFSIFMIYRVVPRYGTKNPMVYLSICSLVGSVSVMAIKGFGVALKLTFAGNNQLTHMSTYVFGVTVVGCILVQMNYFNKALDTFSTNVVNPIYYVFFTTATIIASAILFQGFNTTGAQNTVSLLCGFLVIFMGVYLLNISRQADKPHHTTSLESGLMNPRMSMSGRMSTEGNGPGVWNYATVPTGPSYVAPGELQSPNHGRRSQIYRAQNSTLFTAFEEDGVALSDLPEDDDESDDDSRRGTGVTAAVGGPGGGRSLLGNRRDVEGGRHPAYQEAQR